MIEERVDDLLGRMTLDEKLAQLGGVWITVARRATTASTADHVLPLIPHGIGHVTRIGASTGLRPPRARR